MVLRERHSCGKAGLPCRHEGSPPKKAVLAAVRIACGAACRTYAVEIVYMAAQHKAVRRGNLLLQLFDALIADFHDRAADKADHVIMMAVGVGHFVAGNAVAEVGFGGKPGIAQELQGPVDGCLPDAGVFLLDMQIEFFERMMPGKVEKGLGNGLALRRCIQSFTAHEVQKGVDGRLRCGVGFFFHGTPQDMAVHACACSCNVKLARCPAHAKREGMIDSAPAPF